MANQKKEIPVVNKPYLRGSYHGKDAWKTLWKKLLGLLGIFVLFFLGGTMLGLGGLLGTLIPMAALILVVAFHQYGKGQEHGTSDVTFGEILYGHEQEGKVIDPADRERCFHPGKGFFVALLATLPFLVLAIVQAIVAEKTYYTLGVLPSWTEEMRLQDEFSGALQYYAQQPAATWQDVLRAIVRGMCLPMMSIARSIGGTDGMLIAERLAPLFVLIPALCYGFGYLTGPSVRAKINTGIKIGVEKKKRKQRKERRRRQASNTPERLI
jgi:hypothetical protein